MTLPVTSIRPPVGIEPVDINLGNRTSSATGVGAFQSMLSDAVGQVQRTGNTSQLSIERFLSGENQEIHQVAIQTQQAGIAFDMFMAVRNKMVQAYQEVMKMQM